MNLVTKKILGTVAALHIFGHIAVPIVLGAYVAQAKGQVGHSESNEAEANAIMRIQITNNGKTTVFVLNNSRAAKDLYAQLPLSIKAENYGDNEKIFYPPKKLSTANTPQADAKDGTLAYYAPWGDVVMFYSDFGSAPGLYELGHAVSGREHITDMNGILRIEKSPLQFIEEN